jgi:hypothetical protein
MFRRKCDGHRNAKLAPDDHFHQSIGVAKMMKPLLMIQKLYKLLCILVHVYRLLSGLV